MSRYQLRRMGEGGDLIGLDSEVVKFGRNPEQVNVVLHSNCYSNMISREHAEIRRQRNTDGTTAYFLTDKSLNGTYINDHRVAGGTLLHPGDVIAFGHINGAAIQPGFHAPQTNPEFAYVFEKVPRSSGTGTMLQHPTSTAASTSADPRLTQAPAVYPTSSTHQHPYAHHAQQHAQRLAAVAGYQSYSNTPGFPNFNPYAVANLASMHPAYAAALYNQRVQQQSLQGGTSAALQQWHQQQQYQQAVATTAAAANSSSCALTTSWTQGQGQAEPSSQSYPTKTAAPEPARSQASEQDALQRLQPETTSASLSRAQTTAEAILQAQRQAQQQQQLLQHARLSHPSPSSSVIMTPSAEPKKEEAPEIIKPRSPQKKPPMVAVPDVHEENDAGALSDELKALAASALVAKDSPEDPLFGVESPEPSTSRPSPPKPSPVKSRLKVPLSREEEEAKKVAKEKRKSNEVARLLNDLTEGSFHHQAARASRSSKKSPAAASPPKDPPRSPPPPHEASPSPSNSSTSASSDVAHDQAPLSPASVSRDKTSPLKKRKGFRSPVTPASPALPSPPPEPKVGKKGRPSKKAKKAEEEKEDSDDGMSLTRLTRTLAKKGKAGKGKLKVALKPSVTRARKAKAVPPNKPAKPTKRKRRRSESSESEEEEEVEPKPITVFDPSTHHDAAQACASGRACLKPQKDNVQWVGCEDCDSWFHADCVDVEEDRLDDEDFEYRCERCEA